jgi:hypothetical protein
LARPTISATLLRTSFPDVAVEHHDRQACFKLDEWLHTDIRGWTLAEHVDDDQFARVRERAGTTLNRFVGARPCAGMRGPDALGLRDRKTARSSTSASSALAGPDSGRGFYGASCMGRLGLTLATVTRPRGFQ